MHVAIRLAVPADTPDMAEIHARSWEAAYRHNRVPPWTRAVRRLQGGENPRRIFLQDLSSDPKKIKGV